MRSVWIKFRAASWLVIAVLWLGLVDGVTQAQSDPSSSADEALLAQVVAQATGRIQALAVRDPGAFARVLRQSFGARLNTTTERELIRQAAAHQLSLPGRIIFVPAETLPDAGAAYSSENGGVIFLNSLLRSDFATLTDLVVHELGHHLDALLGAGDAPGEEGQQFLLGVNNRGPVSIAWQLVIAASDQDHATIEFEGRTITVERSLWSWLKRKVIKPLATIAKAAVSTAVNVVANGVSYVGNSIKAGVQLTASGFAAVTGNKELAVTLLKGAKDSYKAAANNILDNLAAAGDLYNKTSATLNKIVPLLGSAMEVAVAFTPAAVYVAAAKGFADVKNAYENGGIKSALTATMYASLDIGGAALGRVSKGIKAAKVETAVQKAEQKAAMNAFHARNPHIAELNKPGFFGGTIKPGLAKADKWFDEKVVQNLPVVKNLDKYKYTKATNAEKAFGAKIIDEGGEIAAIYEGLGYLRKADLVIRSKDYIPGRDRDDEGKLLGTGDSQWGDRIGLLSNHDGTDKTNNSSSNQDAGQASSAKKDEDALKDASTKKNEQAALDKKRQAEQQVADERKRAAEEQAALEKKRQEEQLESVRKRLADEKAAQDRKQKEEEQAALEKKRRAEEQAALERKRQEEHQAALDKKRREEEQAALEKKRRAEEQAVLERRRQEEQQAALDKKRRDEEQQAAQRRLAQEQAAAERKRQADLQAVQQQQAAAQQQWAQQQWAQQQAAQKAAQQAAAQQQWAQQQAAQKAAQQAAAQQQWAQQQAQQQWQQQQAQQQWSQQPAGQQQGGQQPVVPQQGGQQPALPQQGGQAQLLKCWYNDNGTSTGADSAGGRDAANDIVKTGQSGDYAWYYVIARGASGGQSCPRPRAPAALMQLMPGQSGQGRWRGGIMIEGLHR